MEKERRREWTAEIRKEGRKRKKEEKGGDEQSRETLRGKGGVGEEDRRKCIYKED